jgi:hypothetical protein
MIKSWRFKSHSQASSRDIAGFIDEEFGSQMLVDSVRHYNAKLPRFCVVRGISMDGRRLARDSSETDHSDTKPETVLQNFRVALVVNVDETRHEECVDIHAEKLVVPDLYEEATIRIPVERKAKGATLLAAITADGTHLKPLSVINRESCEAELSQVESTPDKMPYVFQENGFITAKLCT